MQFKARHRWQGEIMHLVNRNGGVDNAFTWTDFTAL
jgi:hypothetical protein